MSIFSKWFSNKKPESSTSDEPKKPRLSASDYCEQGQKSLDAGKYVEAMEYFQAAIETDKRFEKAYFLLSEVYEKQGKKDKAKAALYGLLAIDPNNAEAMKRIQGETVDSKTNAVASFSNSTISNNPNSSSSTLPNTSSQNNTPLSSNGYDVSVDFERNRLYYKIFGNEAYVVAPQKSKANSVLSRWNGYKEPEGKVKIPSEVVYNGNPYRVSKIEEFTFAYCKKIIHVEIPQSIIAIGSHAFSDCNKLKSVSIPSSVVTIGEYAFSHCSLRSINIPSSVLNIGTYAFSHCSLRSINFPSSIHSIGSNAFSDNPIRRFAFPEGTQKADASLVYGCKKLSSIVLPNTVKTLFGKWGSSIADNLLIIMLGFPPIVQDSIEENIRIEVPYGLIEEYRNAKYWQCCNLRSRKKNKKVINIDFEKISFKVTKFFWALLCFTIISLSVVLVIPEVFDDGNGGWLVVLLIILCVVYYFIYVLLYLLLYRRDNKDGNKFGEGKYNPIVFRIFRNVIYSICLLYATITLICLVLDEIF